MVAEDFIEALSQHQSDADIEKNQRFFKGEDGKTKSLGIRFGTTFKVAKEYMAMPLIEIEKLLDNHFYEVRMGAVSIMDFQARSKKTTEERKKQLYNLYLLKHDRLNNWDFVDRAAPYVVGGYLFDKSRKPLYELAKSENVWERRTAIVSTYFFIRKNDLEDTFRISEILIDDSNEYVQKAVGSWLREAGKKDETQLKFFLDKYAATMPRVTLRYSIEKFDKDTRTYYLNLKKEQ